MNITELNGKLVGTLDAHGILYQVFHTMGEMSNARGEPTGATFGFVRDLIFLLGKERFDYLFCAFDLPGGTFRHQLYQEYKANRSAMPNDLSLQIRFVRDFLPAFGIVPLSLSQYEADDILATVADRTTQCGGDCLLVTADKDARQLISDKVTLFNLRKQARYGKAELLADWGITPAQVVDFQAIVGDSSDNVPGVPLVGPKSAADLLQRFGSIEGIYDHIDQLTGKKRENFIASKETVEMSRRLVRLCNDLPIEIDWNASRFIGIDPKRLAALCNYFGFRSLIPKIDELAKRLGKIECPAPPPDYIASASYTPKQSTIENHLAPGNSKEDETFFSTSMPLFAEDDQEESVEAGSNDSFPVVSSWDDNVTWHLVDTIEKWEQFFNLLNQQKIFSIDLETTSVRPRFAKIVGIAFCFDAANAWYLPIRGPLGSDILPESLVLEKLKPIVESAEIAKVGQNIKYDMIVLQGAGIRMRGVRFDTMVADYLLRTGERSHNLDELSNHYLDHETIKISELIGSGKNQKTIDLVPTELVAQYAGEDALVAWLLYPILSNRLSDDPELIRLLNELELPLIDSLVEMEYRGIAVDTEKFKEIEQRLQERINQLEREIRDIVRAAGLSNSFADSFNLQSPKQLQQVLFDELKLPVIKKTKTGRSTDVEVLEELAPLHPFVRLLIEHRQLSKLMGTYVTPLPLLLHPETKRIHASFNQVVTATGRLSSSDPNLQNIPIRTAEGKWIRDGFVPDKSLGFDILYSADYSQIELRMLAHLSGDSGMVAAFNASQDIHAIVASHLFGVAESEVTDLMRRKAKAVNFGLIYGQSAFGLAKSIDISREEASRYIDSFFRQYPDIHDYFNRVLDEAAQTGFVQTIFGRKRRIEGVRTIRPALQLNMPERTAINTVIQGSAADLMKQAMVNLYRRLYEKEKIAPAKVRLLLQIHDELLFETDQQFLPQLRAIVEEEMGLGQPLIIPLQVDSQWGPAWGSV